MIERCGYVIAGFVCILGKGHLGSHLGEALPFVTTPSPSINKLDQPIRFAIGWQKQG